MGQFNAARSMQFIGDSFSGGETMRKFLNILAVFAVIGVGDIAVAADLNHSMSDLQESTNPAAYTAATWERLRALGMDTETTIWNAACCKTCRKGKACGNSCISRSKTCRKGRGCACDG